MASTGIWGMVFNQPVIAGSGANGLIHLNKTA